MAHLAIASTKGSTTFSPLSKAYDRITQEGSVPVFNFLIGTHYNTLITGQMSVTSIGDIVSDTLAAVSGKLEIEADANSGTVEKIGTFSTFTFMYPGTRFIGHSELQDDTLLANELERIRYQWEDLSTGDKIIVDLESHVLNAKLFLREEVDGVEKILIEKDLTVNVQDVIWELDFNEDGVSKLWYKEPNSLRTRIFNDQITADIGEAKVSCRLITNMTVVKKVKSDLFFVFYKNINVNYDVPTLTDLTKGRLRIFDTNGEVSESLWTEVFSSDHTFSGERVIQNGLIRVHIKDTPEMELWGWNASLSVWRSLGSNVPRATNGDLANTLHDVIFETFTDSQCKFTIKWGVVDHVVDMKRGMPYVRIVQNSTMARIKTTTRRFALSTAVNTDIPDFNQENSDNTNRGNPLNLSPTVNPFIFTDDTDIDTGLQLMNDNWFAWYDHNSTSNMVAFLGNIKRPVGLQVSATAATNLEFIDITWDIKGIYCIGTLESDNTIKISGIPKPFSIGVQDEYVKWRATEGLMGFNQRPFLRKKR